MLRSWKSTICLAIKEGLFLFLMWGTQQLSEEHCRPKSHFSSGCWILNLCVIVFREHTGGDFMGESRHLQGIATLFLKCFSFFVSFFQSTVCCNIVCLYCVNFILPRDFVTLCLFQLLLAHTSRIPSATTEWDKRAAYASCVGFMEHGKPVAAAFYVQA